MTASMRASKMLLAVLLVASPTRAAPAPVRVVVDATEAARHILHTRLTLPVAPGALTLVYPRWIPGEHGPTGPIGSLVGLRMTARNRPLTWRRDPGDAYAFHLEIPAGTSELEVAFDVVPGGPSAHFSADASTTGQLAVISWNQLVLVPAGARMRELTMAPSLLLPAGWRLATALTSGRQAGARTDFAPVPLETLVDSPVLAGQILRTVDLAPGATPAHLLHMAGESAAAVAAPF
jgi:predicted metalloprotease with PDZ domain